MSRPLEVLQDEDSDDDLRDFGTSASDLKRKKIIVVVVSGRYTTDVAYVVYDPATGTSSQPSRIGDWPDTVPGLSSFTTLPNDAAVKKWVTISADTDMMAQDHVKFGFSAWAKRKYLDWEIHDIFDDKDDKSKEIRALFGQYLCRQISVFLQKRRLSDPALAGADLEIIGPGGFEYLEDWKDWNMPRSGLQKDRKDRIKVKEVPSGWRSPRFKRCPFSVHQAALKYCLSTKCTTLEYPRRNVSREQLKGLKTPKIGFLAICNFDGLDGDISASVINGTTSLDPWKTIKSRSYRMKYVDHIASELKNSELVTAKLPHVPPGSIVELDQPYSLPGRLLEYQKSLNWDSETADPPFALSWAIELPISEPATTKWYKKASRGRRREFERVKLTRKEFIELHREVLDKGIHRPWPPSTVLAILVGKIQQPGTIESYLATLSKSESELPIIWAPDDPANAILSGSLQLYLQLYEGKLGKNSSTLPEIPETMSTTLNTQIMSNDLIQNTRMHSIITPSTTKILKYDNSDDSTRHIYTITEWKKGRLLGGGGFGEVWLHENVENSSDVRAVKIISKATGVNHGREILAASILNKYPAFFIKFLGWYDDDMSTYLVMDYYPLGDLADLLVGQKEISLDDSKSITRQILEGLNVMHAHGFCHRDLKPANIFLQSTSPIWVKLGDFGVTKRITDTTVLETMIFTPGYVAPEILRRLAANPQDSNLPYTNAVDIWSLGVIVHEILTGRLPVHDTAKKLDLRRLAAMEAPTSAIQFVESALEKDPRCRPTARELVVHEWINREGGGGESVEFLGWLDQFVKGNGVPREEETGISQDVVETWYPPEEGYPEVRRTTF